jgi:hypothetical protein
MAQRKLIQTHNKRDGMVRFYVRSFLQIINRKRRRDT